MINTTISEEALSILRDAKISGDAVILPPEQLSRKLYEEVNKVLTDAGGKWDKKTKSHIFKTDPTLKLVAVFKSGTSVNEKQKHQAFFTPPEIVQRLVKSARVEKGHVVLEPSAGTGNIADVCRSFGATVICVESNQEYVEALAKKEYKVIGLDFLTIEPIDFHKSQLDRIDCVIMNPPFSKGQDVRHVEHAWKFLRPGGWLAAIMSNSSRVASWLDKTRTKKGYWRYFDWEFLPEGTFKESGTNIKTRLVTLQKR